MVEMIVPLLILSSIHLTHLTDPLSINSGNRSKVKGDRCRTRRGQFAHPVFCDWFYNCWDGAVYEQRCPQGLVFESSYGRCDYPANVDCTNRIVSWDQERDSRCPTSSGVYADPSRGCSAFVICERGLPVEFSCGDQLFFDPATSVCDYAYKLRSVCRYDPNPGDDFRCPRANGVFSFDSDEGDCDVRFWLCEDYRTTVMTCDDGTVFDDGQGRCVHPRYARCRYDYELPVNAVVFASLEANSTKPDRRH